MKNKQELLSDLNPRFFDPKNDAAFHKVFVYHLDLTKSFLNATLRLKGEQRIKKVEKLPIDQQPFTAESKRAALNALGTDESGFQYIIQVQNRYMYNFFKRVKYYPPSTYIKQPDYKTLKPVTLINISDHTIFPDTVDHLSFIGMQKKTSMSPTLTIHACIHRAIQVY
jgi:predicted transposase/invertase (TIGR01784 family)